MRFMQTESVLQTKNRSGPAKNWFSVALLALLSLAQEHKITGSYNCASYKSNNTVLVYSFFRLQPRLLKLTMFVTGLSRQVLLVRKLIGNCWNKLIW